VFKRQRVHGDDHNAWTAKRIPGKCPLQRIVPAIGRAVAAPGAAPVGSASLHYT
jgi:hypothetical protein